VLDEAGNWRVDERVGARGQAVWAGLAAGGGDARICGACAAPLGRGCPRWFLHPGLYKGCAQVPWCWPAPQEI
jgi:hypothetical protein